MRSILDELWYGNICPNTRCRESTAEAKRLMEYIVYHRNIIPPIPPTDYNIVMLL